MGGKSQSSLVRRHTSFSLYFDFLLVVVVVQSPWMHAEHQVPS